MPCDCEPKHNYLSITYLWDARKGSCHPSKTSLLNGILKGVATAQSPQIKISMIEAITPTACRKKTARFLLAYREISCMIVSEPYTAEHTKREENPPTKVWLSSRTPAGFHRKIRHIHDTFIYYFSQAESNFFF